MKPHVKQDLNLSPLIQSGRKGDRRIRLGAAGRVTGWGYELCVRKAVHGREQEGETLRKARLGAVEPPTSQAGGGLHRRGRPSAAASAPWFQVLPLDPPSVPFLLPQSLRLLEAIVQ